MELSNENQELLKTLYRSNKMNVSVNNNFHPVVYLHCQCSQF